MLPVSFHVFGGLSLFLFLVILSNLILHFLPPSFFLHVGSLLLFFYRLVNFLSFFFVPCHFLWFGLNSLPLAFFLHVFIDLLISCLPFSYSVFIFDGLFYLLEYDQPTKYGLKILLYIYLSFQLHFIFLVLFLYFIFLWFSRNLPCILFLLHSSYILTLLLLFFMDLLISCLPSFHPFDGPPLFIVPFRSLEFCLAFSSSCILPTFFLWTCWYLVYHSVILFLFINK